MCAVVSQLSVVHVCASGAVSDQSLDAVRKLADQQSCETQRSAQAASTMLRRDAGA